MKKIKIILLFLFATSLLSGYVFIQEKNVNTEKIKWMTFQQAIEKSKKKKKKIFIDVYTNWCGWCKVMDKNTFTNPVIIKYMNEKYYAVKLNAEMNDTIFFNNYTFVNPTPKIPRSTHQLAASLLNNQLSYPTTVYLDKDFKMLSQVPGYQKPAQMEVVMKYFGSDDYKKTKWEDYQKTFKSEITP
ncbi:MAG: DUF255 domain-containing protein [Bacteroidota bacterium]